MNWQRGGIAAALVVVLVAGCGGGASSGDGKSVEIKNASYDPTRELWKDLNTAFVADYAKSHGVNVTIKQSHAGSGNQARAIIDGLDADVATLSLWPDVDALRKNGLLKEGWTDRLENKSVPYTSTVVFVTRKGNPKGIAQWEDLGKPGISVITPNPKTSGNGRLTFLGAWGSVVLNGGAEEAARDLLTRIYKNVEVLDTGARGATTTFSQKEIGDVFVTMESEAYLLTHDFPNTYEIVYPAVSVLHEPPLAVVDSVVEKKGTRSVAEDYLKFVYTPAGQEIVAKHYFRPINPEILAKHASQFPAVKLFRLEELVPTWDEAQQKFFAEGGVFDSLYQPDKVSAAK